MRIRIDRPTDRLLVDRAELLCGRVEGACGPFSLTARVGGRALHLAPCRHPSGGPDPGFWGYVFAQEVLDAADGGVVSIDFSWGDAAIGSVRLALTPIARELALSHPLDLSRHAVPIAARRERPWTIVFPGLGGVGGASLNQVVRVELNRRGWALPVYHEADHRGLWRAITDEGVVPPRWIDGHACFAAADGFARASARVTLLREPLRRIVSVFRYNALVHPEGFAGTAFEDFVASGAARRFSMAVGLLRCAGQPAPEGLPDAELHALAHDQLEREYALVGITERFEESLFLLCDLAGWDAIGVWWRVLAAPRTLDLERLPSRLRLELERALAVDLRLYDDWQRAFLATEDRLDFEPALARYRAAAARQRELPDLLKTVECLRWRQVLHDAGRSA